MNPKTETFEQALSSLVGLSTEIPVLGFFLLAAVSMLPFMVLALTSFIKLSVVFGILRSALGAGNIPSSSVIALLSLLLSLHIMAPIFSNLQLEEVETQIKLEEDATRILNLVYSVKQPLVEFLKTHSRLKERQFFLAYSGAKTEINCIDSVSPCKLAGENLFTLIPAFVLSELREAFAIGFLLFLPFLVVDLVVANILVGMGMMMVSPAAISLPFKILLFVACDGWFLLSRSLVMGYGVGGLS